MSSTCASVILEVLEHKGDKTLDWKGMDERQKEAAKELLVLTHIAEAAVPIQEEACPRMNFHEDLPLPFTQFDFVFRLRASSAKTFRPGSQTQ